MQVRWNFTGWQRCIGCLKLQVSFQKRAPNYRALLLKMTYNDKASYGSLPPCTNVLRPLNQSTTHEGLMPHVAMSHGTHAHTHIHMPKWHELQSWCHSLVLFWYSSSLLISYVSFDIGLFWQSVWLFSAIMMPLRQHTNDARHTLTHAFIQVSEWYNNCRERHSVGPYKCAASLKPVNKCLSYMPR